ncbi:MAG: adenylate/guanylate cyclase domain-containing protein, partial [Lentisphaerae bacterium]|nr:adenylate/guanylate cyclase domain-containing protein [Lentisphaerota bacterium]
MSNDKLQFVTLMFVDIPTAVSVREAEGDDVANAMVEECVSLISVVRKKHSGKLIRTVGSSMICSFEGGDDALFAARTMQTCITEHQFHCETAPALRIGLHAGDVVFRNGMCTGETVTTAARLVTLAAAGQVVATEEVYSHVSNEAMEMMRPMAAAEAMQGRLRTKIFEVLWRPAPVLKMVSEAPVSVAAPRILTFERRIRLDQAVFLRMCSAISIGAGLLRRAARVFRDSPLPAFRA